MVNKTKSFKVDDYKVTYTNAAQKAIFEKIVNFAKETQCFTGESATQDDNFMIESGHLLAEIIDDIGFLVENLDE